MHDGSEISAAENKIGKSIKEENCEKIINEIFEKSKKYSCTITLPVDVLIGKNLNGVSKVKKLNNIANFKNVNNLRLIKYILLFDKIGFGGKYYVKKTLYMYAYLE